MLIGCSDAGVNGIWIWVGIFRVRERWVQAINETVGFRASSNKLLKYAMNLLFCLTEGFRNRNAIKVSFFITVLTKCVK